MLAKLALLLLVSCAAEAQIEQELKKVRELLDWKKCLEDPDSIAKPIHDIRMKHQDEHLKTIEAIIEPILNEISKNKECDKYYPSLNKANYYAKKMYAFCGGMEADRNKSFNNNKPLTCAYLWYAVPEIYELIRRNDAQIKLCDVKGSFEKTYKDILSNC